MSEAIFRQQPHSLLDFENYQTSLPRGPGAGRARFQEANLGFELPMESATSETD
jgi:hypothetical protein